jgi:hypothetical protein
MVNMFLMDPPSFRGAMVNVFLMGAMVNIFLMNQTLNRTDDIECFNEDRARDKCTQQSRKRSLNHVPGMQP